MFSQRWQKSHDFFIFELHYLLRQPVFLLLSIFVIGYIFFISSDPSFMLTTYVNSPFNIVMLLGGLSAILPALVATFIADSVIRDKKLLLDQLFFVQPIKSSDYLLGRFIAGLLLIITLFLFAAFAIFASQFIPWADQSIFASNSLYPYLFSFLVIVLPNVFFVSSALLLIASLTRSLKYTFAGILIFYIAHIFMRKITHSDNLLSIFLDPFGLKIFFESHHLQFTAYQLDTLMPVLSQELLFNRIFWFVISLTLLFITVASFKVSLKKSKAIKPAKTLSNISSFTSSKRLNDQTISHCRNKLYQCLTLATFDYNAIIKSISFKVIVVIALVSLTWLIIGRSGYHSSTSYYSSTLVDSFSTLYQQILILVVIFYAGEIVYRERGYKISPLTDLLPVNNAVWFSAKSLSLIMLLITFQVAGVLLLLLFQMGSELPAEPLILLSNAAIASIRPIFFAISALAIQAFLSNKYLGFFIMIIILALQSLFPDNVGSLFYLALLPKLYYSDFNGYGHYLIRWSVFTLYWLLVLLSMALIATAFWSKGEPSTFVQRLHNIRKPSTFIFFPLAFIFIVFTSFSYILNSSPSIELTEEKHAKYELTYQHISTLPQMKVEGIYTEIDIYPNKRRAELYIRYALINETQKSIQTVYIDYPISTTLSVNNKSKGQVTTNDEVLGFLIYKLDEPVLPGAKVQLEFIANRQEDLSSNSWVNNLIQPNVTYLTSKDILPSLGYNPDKEIGDKAKRIEFNLPAEQNSPNNLDGYFFGEQFNMVDFEAILSTTKQQIALTTGKLKKTWVKGNRRFFHYKASNKVAALLPFISGEYQEKSIPSGSTVIKLYHYLNHNKNTEHILANAKAIIGYYNQKFSSYTPTEINLLEITSPYKVGIAFNGVVALSETSIFTTSINDQEVDFAYFMLAHEIAHQWWGNQLIPNKNDGALLLVESLAQYSAYMAIKEHYGKDYLKKVLAGEHNRYFLAPSTQPLISPLNNNNRSFYYEKGGLALYHLQQQLGENVLNEILNQLLSANHKKSYTSAITLIDALLMQTDKKYHPLINELFKEVVTYDNQIIESKAYKQENGDWLVTATIKKQAFNKDKQPIASEYPANIELGIKVSTEKAPSESQDSLVKVFQLNTREALTEISFITKQKPTQLELDPWSLYLDKNRKDNLISIDIEPD